MYDVDIVLTDFWFDDDVCDFSIVYKVMQGNVLCAGIIVVTSWPGPVQSTGWTQHVSTLQQLSCCCSDVQLLLSWRPRATTVLS